MRRCGKSYLLFNLFKEYLVNEGVTEKILLRLHLTPPFESVHNSIGQLPDLSGGELGSNAE